MYIEPNSDVRLLSGIPLDASYEHTIYFENEQAQYSYFASRPGKTYSNQYYVRRGRRYIRLEFTDSPSVTGEARFNYNYMMFRNTSYNSKWFYAFILNPVWINNQVVQFEFELDVMQTWFFAYELLPSFIDREHSATDEIGEHTVPETLETGPYQFLDGGLFDEENHSFTTYKICIIASVTSVANPDPEDPQTEIIIDYIGGRYTSGVYNGLCYNLFDTPAQADNFLKLVTDAGKVDAIVAIYMVPNFCTTTESTGSPHANLFEVDKNYAWTYTYNGKTGPRNKKLYSYPYNKLLITDNQGNGAEFRFEYFDTVTDPTKCLFQIIGVTSPLPEVQLIPIDYNGVLNDYKDKLVLRNFPQCSWVTDTFRAWLAQNWTNLVINGSQIATDLWTGNMSAVTPSGADLASLTGLISGKVNPMTTEGMSSIMTPDGGANIAQSIGKNTLDAGFKTARLLSTIYQHDILPPTSHGQMGSSLSIATKTLGFRKYAAYVRPEYAAIIDDYFDRYGYACHLNKVPNRNVRPHWTYTKTVGCMVAERNGYPKAPGADLITIQNIYDKGITFWRNASEIGNYSLDNRPV